MHDQSFCSRGMTKRFRLKRKAVYIASLLILAAASPVVADTARKDIKAYFAAIPAEVFDDTTDGLDDEARKILLEKGRTEDWVFKRISTGKATLTAVHPSSVVTMRLMNFGRNVLQVHIQNEKAEIIGYWTFAKAGAQLEAYQPRAALRAAAAALHDLERDGRVRSEVPVNPLIGVPSDIIAHVDALEACRKVNGEPPDRLPKQDAVSNAKDQHLLQCGRRSEIEAELRRKHAKRPIAGAMLDRANTIFDK
jgi:hypothetical protein